MFKNYNLSPYLYVKFSTLLAWEGYNEEKALEFILNSNQNNIDEMGSCNSSISIGKQLFEKYFLLGEKIDDNYFYNLPLNVDYFHSLENKIKDNFSNTKIFKLIIEIISQIHDKWVMENASKYSRDDNKLFQHLPTFLIGEKEFSKDFIFISPLFRLINIEIGDMEIKPFGDYILSNDSKLAYTKYVKTMLSHYKINSEKSLKETLPLIIENYNVLIFNDDSSLKSECISRLNYMLTENAQNILVKTVWANIKKYF